MLVCGAAALIAMPMGLAQTTGTTFEFATDTFFEFEDAGTATVEVRRSGDLSQTQTVDYAATGVIALPDIDFVSSSGTLTFEPDETSKVFEVTFIDDSDPEGSEPIAVNLSNPSEGAELGAVDEARLYVQDNERRGTLIDFSFDGAIAESDLVRDIALWEDGRIMATGDFQRPGSPIVDRVLLFDEDGRRDRDFDMENEVPNSVVSAVAIQADGKVLIGGDFTLIGDVDLPRIARLRDDGLIDNTFSPGSGPSGQVFDIVLQDDGKILIMGLFDSYGGQAQVGIARLNTNGSLDVGFDLGGGVASTVADFTGPWVTRAAIQDDGKIVIGGQFTSVDSLQVSNLARLNADGSVDPSFSTGAGATGPFASVEALALQPDGRVLIGGDFDSYDGARHSGLARLRPNGMIDETFNIGVGVEGEDRVNGGVRAGFVSAIEVLDDGKILVAGDFDEIDEFGRRGIARLFPDGTIDGTFGPYFGTTYRLDGAYQEYELVTALAVQEDGKVVTGGRYENPNGPFPTRLNRLLERNALENTVEFDFPRFSTSEGAGSLDITVIRRGPSDRAFSVDFFVIGGTAVKGEDYELEAGTLSFEPLEVEKVVTIELINDSEAEDNETIELGIRNATGGVGFGDPVTTEVQIIDATKAGNIDLTFSPVFIPPTADRQQFPSATDIVIQPDRKILLAGYFTFVNTADRPGLVRFELDGRVDDSFVPTAAPGDLIVDFDKMALQPDGSVVGGRFALSQFDAIGTRSQSFNTGVSFAPGLVPAPDGSFIVSDNFLDPASGAQLNEVVRFMPDGSIDAQFIPAALNDWAVTGYVQEDGKVVLGGWFTEVNGVAQNRVVRLNEDGSRDRDFDIGVGVEGVTPPVVLALAGQPDGKVIVVGQFELVDGLPRANLARLNTDGSVDTSFDPGFGANRWIQSVALQEDGKILIGGAFSDYDGMARVGFARINPDGSLDEAFAPDLSFPEGPMVSAIAVQEDGQILIGGAFEEVNGILRVGFTRINGDDAASIVPPEPPAPAPVPTSVSVAAGATIGAFLIEFETVAGLRYEIQASGDLTDWTTLTSIDGGGGIEQYEDSSSALQSVRFYRVVVSAP